MMEGPKGRPLITEAAGPAVCADQLQGRVDKLGCAGVGGCRAEPAESRPSRSPALEVVTATQHIDAGLGVPQLGRLRKDHRFRPA